MDQLVFEVPKLLTADEINQKKRLKRLKMNKWEDNQITYAYPARRKQLIRLQEAKQ